LETRDQVAQTYLVRVTERSNSSNDLLKTKQHEPEFNLPELNIRLDSRTYLKDLTTPQGT